MGKVLGDSSFLCPRGKGDEGCACISSSSCTCRADTSGGGCDGLVEKAQIVGCYGCRWRTTKVWSCITQTCGESITKSSTASLSLVGIYVLYQLQDECQDLLDVGASCTCKTDW